MRAPVDKYIDSLLETFEEVIRVLKSTGNIIYNIGDKYIGSSLLLVPYRFAISATRRYPIRLINDITWVKRNPTPRQFARRLVSGTEPFFHFAKGSDYYYDLENFLKCEDKDKRPAPTGRMGERYRSLIAQSNLSDAQKRRANESLDNAIREVTRGEIQSFRMKIKGIHAEAFGGQEGGRKTANGQQRLHYNQNTWKKDEKRRHRFAGGVDSRNEAYGDIPSFNYTRARQIAFPDGGGRLGPLYWKRNYRHCRAGGRP